MIGRLCRRTYVEKSMCYCVNMISEKYIRNCPSLPNFYRCLFTRSNSNQKSGPSVKLSDHQRKIMARGLPKKHQLSMVKNVVLVASGKGGVGKSTTAVNLAISMKQLLGSEEVGLLDMDIYGPSLPIMMNLNDHKPDINKDDNMIPLLNYGIHCMSVGFLVPASGALVWRGPMLLSCSQRLLLRTAWPPLHTLLLDMPPGTGDVSLTCAQLLHLTGAVLVTTPQDVALADVRRSAEMLNKVSVPVLGVVQNMSLHRCSACGHTEHIFGRDGAVSLSKELGVPVLGDVPIDLAIREAGDSGRPVALTHPHGPQAEAYRNIAQNLLERMAESAPLS